MPVAVFFAWLALVWGAGWLAFPFARRIFAAVLPDGGLAVGRVLFLALWTLGAFWAGHAGLATPLASWFWVVLALGGAGAAWRARTSLKGELGARQRALIATEAIFLGTFLLFFALRGFWSDTNGTNGEKGMDAALIGTIARAPRLPPPNPYAAGAQMRGYYYFGHLETALLTDAVGTQTRWSYNLMCATLPALCFSTLFSLGAALTGRLRGGAFVSGAVLGLGTLQPLAQWAQRDPNLMARPLGLDFFATSRVIPYSINEYPFFTFNQADLHAHYFDFPFALATIGLSYAIFRGRRSALWLAPLVLGAQVMTNTWDFPAYAILLGLATLFSPCFSALWARIGVAAAMIAGALLVAAPYLLNLKTAANRPQPLPQPASPLGAWLLLWGVFALAWALWLWHSERRGAEGAKFAWPIAALALALWAILRAATGQSYAVLVVEGTLIAGTLWPMARGEKSHRFLAALALCGLLALLWSETTWAGFLGDANHPGFDDYKRQDTVFKFGLQTWMLWGIAAASGAFLTLRQWPEWIKCAFLPALSVMWLASLSVVVGRTQNFGRSPDPWRLTGGFDAWDAWAHLAPSEKDAALWLQANTPPGQNLLEAENLPGGDYSPFARYAHATGIPTVIGPQAHSFQWSPAQSGDIAREWAQVAQRKSDARAAYTLKAPPAARRALLTRYGVRYVVWGELEKREYGAAALDILRQSLPQVARFGADSDPHRVLIFENPRF